MNENTELRDRQSQHAERLIRLETLIEQNQERVNRYEEDQRAFVNRYEEDQRSFVSRYEQDQREAGKSGLSPSCAAVGLRSWRLSC